MVDTLDVTRNRDVSVDCACSAEIVYCISTHLITSKLDGELALDGRVGLEDGVGEREEEEREPDDEDEHEQEQASDPVLDHSLLLHPSRRRVSLQRNKSDLNMFI